jgi:hypothetical protein
MSQNDGLSTTSTNPESIGIGDRVMLRGWPGERDRYGTVVECYRGIKSTSGPGVEMLAVKWDGGQVERGYLRQGALTRYTVVASSNVLSDVLKMIETLKKDRSRSPGVMYLPDEGLCKMGLDPNDYPQLEGYPGVRVVEVK